MITTKVQKKSKKKKNSRIKKYLKGKRKVRKLPDYDFEVLTSHAGCVGSVKESPTTNYFVSN